MMRGRCGKFFSLLVVVGLTLTWLHCERNSTSISDPTSTVYGTITTVDGAALDSVYVGFVIPTDSAINWQNGNPMQHFDMFDFAVNGEYEINWFLGPYPLPYENMYAFKSGYKIWHYTAGLTIEKKQNYLDCLNIIMEAE